MKVTIQAKEVANEYDVFIGDLCIGKVFAKSPVMHTFEYSRSFSIGILNGSGKRFDAISILQLRVRIENDLRESFFRLKKILE